MALRLICEREKEIKAFQTQEYWSIGAELATGKGQKFTANLVEAAGKKLDKFDIPAEEAATTLVKALEKGAYTVDKVTRSERKRTPAPPFTTSTLQQEAARKLGFSAKKTMALAQKLYEGQSVPGEGTHGLITYMRTDSTNLSAGAIFEARGYIEKEYGKQYLSAGPRNYKKSKGAQEAHEAIRPTSFARTPERLADVLEPDMLKLYTLVWKRALASQMSEEILDLTGVDIAAEDYTLRANGKKVRFDGYSKVYLEGSSEKIAEESKEVLLPDLASGDKCDLKSLEKLQKFTQPPARYSEASLIKTLEKNGIGRPSTYAPTLSTIKDRGYVRLEKRQFIPEEIGFIVNDMLVEHFPEVVNIDFTAEMEDELDAISRGEMEHVAYLKDFYFGNTHPGLKPQLDNKSGEIDARDVSRILIGKPDGEGPKAEPVYAHVGRFGPFVGCSRYPDCTYARASLPDGVSRPSPHGPTAEVPG